MKRESFSLITIELSFIRLQFTSLIHQNPALILQITDELHGESSITLSLSNKEEEEIEEEIFPCPCPKEHKNLTQHSKSMNKETLCCYRAKFCLHAFKSLNYSIRASG